MELRFNVLVRETVGLFDASFGEKGIRGSHLPDDVIIIRQLVTDCNRANALTE